jgi:hypothetical protein
MSTLTAEEVARLTNDAFLRASLRRTRIKDSGTYAEFVSQLYEDIDELIYAMQATRELLQGDSEDRLSSDIIRGLKIQGYGAAADGKTGGHVDISVKFGAFSWIGEAKKDGNFNEGYLQLMTRYVPASGNYAHNHGGLIFYMVASPDAKGRLNGWQDELKTKGCICTDCSKNILAFYSDHTLVGPGTPYKVRTMAVSLYHKPQDKSARASAAKKAAKLPKAGRRGGPAGGP